MGALHTGKERRITRWEREHLIEDARATEPASIPS